MKTPRGTVGTPVNVIKSGGSGRAAGKPGGYAGAAGTVRDTFEGDQKGPRQVAAQMSGKQDLGTPYQSVAGNPGDASRIAHGTGFYGVDAVEGGQNMNDASSNGNGTILDHMSRETQYQPRSPAMIDSPVPGNAPFFDSRTINDENRAHAGRGNEATANDRLLPIGGVMSRDMLGTSTPKGGENELQEDDVLKNLGPGGAISR
jgi:hypothetical protein